MKFTAARLRKCQGVMPLRFSDGWVTNGHWMARCDEKVRDAEPLGDARAVERANLARAAKRTAVTRQPADARSFPAFKCDRGTTTYVDALYASLLDGLQVFRLTAKGLRAAPLPDVRFGPADWPIGGFDDDGELAVLVMPFRPAGTL